MRLLPLTILSAIALAASAHAAAAEVDREFVVVASGNPDVYLNQGGITVLDSKGVPIAGSPFDPIVNYDSLSTPLTGPMGFPVRMTLTPSGDLLYAIYYSSDDGYGVASFDMSTGKPQLVSSVPNVIGLCCGILPAPQQLFFSAHDGYVYVGAFVPFPDSGGTTMTIFESKAGVLTFYANVSFGAATDPGVGMLVPLSVQVDAKKHYAYVTYNPADNDPPYGTCTATQCVAIYDISKIGIQTTVAAVPGVLLLTRPNLGDILVGHN